MATRLYLPSDATSPVSPALQGAWSHTSGTVIRREMDVRKRGTAFANLVYTPDAADHLVAGTSHLFQYISRPLRHDQTIAAAQTMTTVQLCLESNAGNNLVMRWGVFVFDRAGTSLRGTVVAMRLDNGELNTTIQSRHDSVNSTSVNALAGDRIVFEMGVSGTPTAAGGVQGHNATFRMGDNAASDLLGNDTQTTDLNPYIDFATSTLVFESSTPSPGSIRPAYRNWLKRR